MSVTLTTTLTTINTAEMNIPYLFVMKMEDVTPAKMAAVGATVVERRGDIEFAIVLLLNPKVMGRVLEDFEVYDMQPLEGNGKPEDQASVHGEPGLNLWRIWRIKMII